MILLSLLRRLNTFVLTHQVRVEVHVVYDYFDVFAGHRRLPAHRIVLFGFLDGGRRLL